MKYADVSRTPSFRMPIFLFAWQMSVSMSLIHTIVCISQSFEVGEPLAISLHFNFVLNALEILTTKSDKVDHSVRVK